MSAERVATYAGKVVAKVRSTGDKALFVKDGHIAGDVVVGVVRMRAPNCNGDQEVQFAAPDCSGGQIVEMKRSPGRVDIKYRNGKSVHIRDRGYGVVIDYDD